MVFFLDVTAHFLCYLKKESDDVGLKKLHEGFHYENNSELCGAQFDSLKACPDDGNDDGKMPHKPESTSVKPQQIQKTADLNRNCDTGGCSRSSTLSAGAVIAGTIIIVAGAAACGLSVFSWHRRQKQRLAVQLSIWKAGLVWTSQRKHVREVLPH